SIRLFTGKVAEACIEGKARYASWVQEHGGRDERAEAEDRDAASERGMKDRRDRRDRRGPRREPREDRGAASANVEVVRKGDVTATPASEPAPAGEAPAKE
ncbi:MAG TPA: 30S ribosomal protein S2, partial [Anaeromyxobacteraceae bacterium]|nr:30S ribosomal protein S2 [Anaeromyxobacteraceae bacterium]